MTSLPEMLVDLPLLSAALVKMTLLLACAWLAYGLLRARNPRWRVLLWRVVLTAIVVLPLAEWALPHIDIAISQETLAPPAHAPSVPEPSVIPINAPARPDATATVPAINEAALPPPSFNAGAWLRTHELQVLIAVWSLVALVLLLRSARGWTHLRKLVSNASPAPDSIRTLADAIAADLDMRVKVDIRVTGIIDSPFLAGIRRPVIVLPTRCATKIDTTQLRAILAHELAHATSRDPFWLACARLTTAMLWFHPLLWRVNAAHASACEEVCDGVATAYLGSAEGYAQALAREALALRSAHAIPGVPMLRDAEIIHRLRKIQQGIRADALARRVVASILLLGITLLATLGCLRFVHAQAPESPTYAVWRESVRRLDNLRLTYSYTRGPSQEYLSNTRNKEFSSDHLALVCATGSRLEGVLRVSRSGDSLNRNAVLERFEDDVQTWKYDPTGESPYPEAPDPSASKVSIHGDGVYFAYYPQRNSGAIWKEWPDRTIYPIAYVLPPDPATTRLAATVDSGNILDFITDANDLVRYYLDPNQGMMPVRIEFYDILEGGKLFLYRFFTVEEYTHTANDAFLPSKSTRHEGTIKDGAVHELVVQIFSMTAYEENVHFGPEEFVFAFPEGAFVTDHIGDMLPIDGEPTTTREPSTREVPNTGQAPSVDASGGSAEVPRAESPIATSDKSKSLVLENPGGPDYGLRDLDRLKSIEHLVLIEKDLPRSAIDRIGSLATLKSLRLCTGRGLTRDDLVSLSRLTNLRELWLEWSRMEPEAYAQLSRFTSVERLCLGGTGHGPEALGHLADMVALNELQILDLNDAELAALPYMPRLQRLDITGEGYEYTAAGFANLSRQLQLKSLKVLGRFEDDAILALSPPPALTHLELSTTFQDSDRITDAALAHVATFTALEDLVLYTGTFTDAGFRHLARLPNLKRLQIVNNTGFTNAILDTLATMPAIEEFKCRGENITGDGLDGLIAARTLKRVEFWLNGGKITGEALRKLSVARPDLTLVIDKPNQ